MLTADEYLEIIVAGIQSVTNQGAKVSWNEKINGRQFDVVVRFRFGLHDYLLVVEVKNKNRPTSVSDIEAFVTKSKDRLANKAVFVSSSGFQSGAEIVARKHGMDLFKISFLEEEPTLPPSSVWLALKGNTVRPAEPPKFQVGAREPKLVFERMILRYVDGTSHDVPNEPSQMQYYIRNTLLSTGISLEQLLSAQPKPNLKLNQKAGVKVPISEGVLVSPPDEYFFPSGKIQGIQLSVKCVLATPIVGSVAFEPGALSYPVEYINLLTGEKTKYSIYDLPLGDEKMVEKQFYFTPHPLNYYYCFEVRSEQIRLCLIEGFHGGNLAQATFTAQKIHSRKYIPVTDPKTLKRLSDRLTKYEKVVAS